MGDDLGPGDHGRQGVDPAALKNLLGKPPRRVYATRDAGATDPEIGVVAPAGDGGNGIDEGQIAETAKRNSWRDRFAVARRAGRRRAGEGVGVRAAGGVVGGSGRLRLAQVLDALRWRKS